MYMLLKNTDFGELVVKVKIGNKLIVLTTSKAEEDIVRCYNLHANCYITKPVDLNQFFQVIKLITEFWWKIVKLSPSNPTNYAII